MSDNPNDNQTEPLVLQGEKQEHGAQVVLGRKAAAYARGGVHGDMRSNLLGKRALEVSGEEADGHSPDGTSVTGKRQRDDVLAEVTDDPSGPPTGATVAEGNRVYDAAGLRGTPHTPAPDNSGGPGNEAPAARESEPAPSTPPPANPSP